MNTNYALLDKAVPGGRLLAGLALSILAIGAKAQLNMAAVNTAYTVNFDGTVAGVSVGVWAGTGFQPTPISGRLDSDAWAATGWSNGSLAFGGTRITAGTDYRRGTTAPGNAAIAVGGMYSFGGVGITGRALGFQPGASDWAPGTITLRVQNTTGSTLTAFDMAYNAYYRNDQNSSSEFDLYYSDDNVTYTHVVSQDLTSPAASTGAAWVANARSTSIGGVNVPNGQYFYVRWRGSDVSVSGARDEFALDDISVTGHAYTMVRLTAATSTVNESVGTTTVTASIVNPHPTNPTTVQLVLTSGPSARINSYSTQTLTFPGGSLANQSATITVTDNGACDGDATEVFTLQSIAGGLGTPSIGNPSTRTMTIDDDETAPVSYAQAFDGGVGDTWPITAGAGNVSTLTGATDTPANQRVLSTSKSWQVRNATATLDLSTISVLDWTSTTLTARVSSTSLTSTDGADGADSIAFYVDVNGGGFPVDPDLRIAGNSNARWGYNTGTGVASTTAGVPVNFQPAGGGNRTTDGYSTVQITIPNGTTTIALRVIAKNNTGNEVWNVDNVSVTGTLCSPVYYSRANGSEATATWSTSRTGSPAPAAVTFTKNATMVIQNGHAVATTTNASIPLRNLNVETGGSLALTGVGTVEINGPTLDVDGSLTAADDNFELKSTELTTISGSAGTIDVNNLSLDGLGAQVTVNTLKIRGTLQLDNGNFDGNNKEVQLLSTATGTARLGPVGGTASYTSRLRLERYIPAGVTDWRLLCSPIQSKTVVDWTDDFYTAGFPGSTYPNFYVNAQLWPSVRKYDETDPGPALDDGLIGVSSTAEALTVGKGFAAWSGTTLNTTTAFTIDVRGIPTVANTPFSIPMSYTNTGTPVVDGLNLVGNPLPSPIDFGTLTLGADVDNSYFIYDPGSGTNAAWDETTQLGTGGANGNIQSSQGFWLHCTGPANSVTVGENAKVLEPINGGIFSDQQDQRLMVRLKLTSEGSDLTDEALVHFIQGEPAYGTHDMVKLTFGGATAPRISTRAASGEDLVINAMGNDLVGTSVPVRVVAPVAGTYTITFNSVMSITGRSCISLEDQMTGTSTMVAEGASYTFTSDVTDDVDASRFVLHFSDPVTTQHSNATCAGSSDGSITVQGAGSGPWNYTLTDAFGNVISAVEGLPAAETFEGLSTGNYQLHVDGSASCGELVQDVEIMAPAALALANVSAPATCEAAENGSIDLTVMGGTAPYAFAWSDGSTAEDLQNAPAGAYEVFVTDANGCQTTLNGMNVGANAGPVSEFSTGSEFPMPDEPIGFFNEGTYGLSYHWEFGDGAQSDESELEHTYQDPGVYTVTLTVTDGACTAVHSEEVEVGITTGINEVDGSGMNAWVEGQQIQVQWQLSTGTGIRAELMDAAGRVVLDRSATGSLGRFAIPAQELPAGVYALRMSTKDVSHTVKLAIGR